MSEIYGFMIYLFEYLSELCMAAWNYASALSEDVLTGRINIEIKHIIAAAVLLKLLRKGASVLIKKMMRINITLPGRSYARRRGRNTVRTVTRERSVPREQTAVPVETVSEETGTVIYFANDSHNSADNEYHFNYKKINGHWRAYILKMPALEGRSENGSITHRLYDKGDPYICWDSPVMTLRDMKAISKVWADNIQEYIATGKQFG